MDATCQRLLRTVKSRKGFTLIEMLIVIIILGILAMVIIPQITVSQEDAKVSTLKTNLVGIRSAIELYYAQHNNVYPGVATDGTNAADTALAFINQLTLYSNAAGATVATKDDTHPFGPYIKGGVLPANPFNSKTDVLYDKDEGDMTKTIGAARVTTGATAYKFVGKLGVIYANDETSAAAGTELHKTY